MGCRGVQTWGGPTLGSSAGIPGLDRPAAGWMTQVLPAGLDVLWQVQPPLPPSPVSALQEAGLSFRPLGGWLQRLSLKATAGHFLSFSCPLSRSEPSSCGGPPDGPAALQASA